MSEEVERILQGEVRAAARLMRDIDDRIPAVEERLKELYPYTGKAEIIGVTGNPGSGKSTLVDRLISRYREMELKVGVVAVDPTSPFSGGAILGDRIRMQRHSSDPGVFIRSLATRGYLGGLSRSARNVARVLDAFGCQRIILETVGVGQDEIDVARHADTTIVITVPGLGDDVQSIKAGILEVADLFVVNKADLHGAERTVRDLEAMLAMRGTPHGEWLPPIVKTVATSEQGLSELLAQIDLHRQYRLKHEGEQEKRSRLRFELIDLVRGMAFDRLEARLKKDHRLEQMVGQLLEGASDPFTLAEQLLYDLPSSASND